MAEPMYFQWQNDILVKTIYPLREMKLRDFLVYYKEIDLWAEYKNKKIEDIPTEVQAYIDRVGKRLLTGTRKVEFPYTFKVLEDKSINAFAIPGGHTYVNTGLIKAAESEDELAAVMAHEINHVVARHSTQQMTKQYGYELISGLLLGSQGAITQMAGQLFGKAGLLYYSREMESQADALGVETMYNAGYDPQGMTFTTSGTILPGQSG